MIYLQVSVVQSNRTSALALKNPPSLCVSILTPCPPHQLTRLRTRSLSNTACHTPPVFSKSTVLSPPLCLQPLFWQLLRKCPKLVIFCSGGKKGCANGV